MNFGILQRYIFKELISGFLLIVSILTLIFFLVAAMQFVQKYSEYISLLDFLALAPYLLIKVVAFTTPLGMLATTTLLYGRMSHDREILIARSAGIHAKNIFRPAFILGFILSIISLYINHELVPYSYIKQVEIRYRALEAILRANFSSKSTTIDYIPNILISYQGLKDGKFQNLIIQSLEQGQVVGEIMAESGILIYDKTQNILTFSLTNGTSSFLKNSSKKNIHEERIYFQEFSFPIPLEGSLEDEANYSRTKYKSYAALIKDTEIWRQKLEQCTQKLHNPPPSANMESLRQDWKIAKEKYMTHVLIWHSRTAISFAPWLVVFLGASLGLLVQHNNRLVAFAVSAIPVILFYYPIQMLGQHMAEKGNIPAAIGGWLGTMATAMIGIALLLYTYRK